VGLRNKGYTPFKKIPAILSDSYTQLKDQAMRFVQVVKTRDAYECEVFDQLPERSPLGASFYDLSEERWVKRGKRGLPIKGTSQIHWCNVMTTIAKSEGSMSEAEIRQSYKESDDSFTEFDLLRWKKSRQTYEVMLPLISDSQRR